MTIDVGKLAAGLTQFWTDWGSLVILGTGLTALALIVWALVRFARSANRSKIVSAVAAVVVMAWTSEGLLAVAIRKIHLPWAFALLVFAVFELMMVAAAMRAEESRRGRGVAGPAGPYVFVIATASGVISAFGARSGGEVALRIILPPLAVGLWWILLTSERDTDSEEIKARRAAARAASEATWAVTPRTVLVRLGVMRPGRSTAGQAQREYLRDRMVALADRAETLPAGWRRSRLVRRLRVLTRAADEVLVADVAERVNRARRAEELMITQSPVDLEVAQMVSRGRGETAVVRGTALPDVRAHNGAHRESVRSVQPRTQVRNSAHQDEDQADAARETYATSVRTGTPISGRALGRQFGRSERWGVDRAREAREELAARSNGHGPVVEVGSTEEHA